MPGSKELGNMRGLMGLSAYEVAVKNGFVGTEDEWLLSLIGGSEAFNAWLEAHPEYTTTVMDDSLTAAKLTPELRGIVEATVRTTVQALTEEQKAQARTNIGLDNIARDFGLYSTDRGVELPAYSDFDEIIDPGMYYCSESSRASTMIHAPDIQMSNFKMFVEKTGSDTGRRQTMYIGSINARVIHRVRTSTGWQNWTWETLNVDVIGLDRGGTGVKSLSALLGLIGIDGVRPISRAIASGNSFSFKADSAIVFAAKTASTWGFYICRNDVASLMDGGSNSSEIEVTAKGTTYTVKNTSSPYLRVYILAEA